MEDKLKDIIKDCAPPFLLRLWGYWMRSGITFSGPYASWNEALRYSTGYDSDTILHKIKESMLRVKEGKAAYERDSVLFEKIDYPFPVIAGLLCAAVVNNGELSVLDFGGSLGSSYYQCRGLLGEIKKLKWSIVEQPKFCSCGKEFFENGELKFYDDMDEYLRNDDPNVAIFSGVIQYIKSPYNLLETTIEKKFRYIIFDRTPFYNKTNETIMVQHVPEQIYKASYPFTIFSLNKFRKVFAQKYEEIAYFDSLEFPALKRFSAKYSGFIFRRIQ